MGTHAFFLDVQRTMECRCEKMKSSLMAENALMVNDRNMLDRLIRQYQQTMGTVMSRAVRSSLPSIVFLRVIEWR